MEGPFPKGSGPSPFWLNKPRMAESGGRFSRPRWGVFGTASSRPSSASRSSIWRRRSPLNLPGANRRSVTRACGPDMWTMGHGFRSWRHRRLRSLAPRAFGQRRLSPVCKDRGCGRDRRGYNPAGGL